jgi:hypothetical protein
VSTQPEGKHRNLSSEHVKRCSRTRYTCGLNSPILSPAPPPPSYRYSPNLSPEVYEYIWRLSLSLGFLNCSSSRCQESLRKGLRVGDSGITMCTLIYQQHFQSIRNRERLLHLYHRCFGSAFCQPSIPFNFDFEFDFSILYINSNLKDDGNTWHFLGFRECEHLLKHPAIEFRLLDPLDNSQTKRGT